jgi:hypothetical protein
MKSERLCNRAAIAILCLLAACVVSVNATPLVHAQEKNGVGKNGVGRTLTSDEVDFIGTIIGIDKTEEKFTLSINRVVYGTAKQLSFDVPRTRSVRIDHTTELLSADTSSLPLSVADLTEGKPVHVIADASIAPGEIVRARAVLAVLGREGPTLLPGNLLKDWQNPKNWTLETLRDPTLTVGTKHLTVMMPSRLLYPWDVMLFQHTALKPNTKYTLRFRIRSEVRRYITVVSGSRTTGKPLADNGLTRTIAVTPAWKDYVIPFETKTADPSATTVAPCLQLGGAAGSVHIADVSLAEGEITLPEAAVAEPRGALIEAPNDPNSWVLFQTEGAVASVTPDKTAIRIDIEKSGAETWHLQLLHPGTNLVDGKEYELSFLGKASRPRSIIVASQVQGGDYHSTGLNETVELNTDWKQYSMRFRATRTIPHQNIAPQFVLGKDTNEPNTIWITNVALKQKD